MMNHHFLNLWISISFFLHVVVEAQQASCGQNRCVDLTNPDSCGQQCSNPCTSLVECAFEGFDDSCPGDFENCVNSATHIAALRLTIGGSENGVDPCDCSITSVVECFSSEASALVESKGKTLVKDIQIGDLVLTGSNEYKPVYTIDHINPRKPTNFIQIYSTGNETPLEVTKSHMVFLHGKKNPVPASAIKVGDLLQAVNGSSVVTDISSITREGLWNPITTDGTIVVDGVVTSTYNIPFENSDEESNVKVAGLSLLSHHDFLHLLSTPYRAICLGLSLPSFCESKREYNIYSSIGNDILKFHRKQSKEIQDMMILSFLVIFKVLNMFMNPLFIVGVISGFYCLCISKRKRFQPTF